MKLSNGQRYPIKLSGFSLGGLGIAVQEILNPRAVPIKPVPVKPLISRRVTALDGIVKFCTAIFPYQLKMKLYNISCKQVEEYI